MGTQMERLVNQHFKELKKRSSLSALDENSKKVEKRKSLDCNLLKGDMVMDLKSVKVLVERTKFNEMQVVELVRNIQSPIKIPNGTLHKAPQKGRRATKKKPALSIAPQRPCIDEHFRARRCYVKVSKDKQLLKLLHIESVPSEKRTSRGRPKKRSKPDTVTDPTYSPSKDEDVVGSAAVSNNLKRKHTDIPDASTLSKRARKNKSSEFFINIDSLLSKPSPRIKSIKSNNAEESKRRAKKTANPLSPVALRQKFGNRFFRSYIKVKRYRENKQPAIGQLPLESETKKKKKGKNLSVSFLETVEIFGESSDGEEYEEPSFSGKASRLKRLDNGALGEDEIAKCSATSTPIVTSRSSQSSDEMDPKADGTPKRKEKISFSPLKEDDASPRKEQLKLANEKIVRLNFEEQPGDEEEPEPASPTPTQNPVMSESPTAQDTDRAHEGDKQQGSHDDDVETQDEPMETSQDPKPVEVEPQLITPPPSEDKNAVVIEDDDEDDDDVMVVPDANADTECEPIEKDDEENLENNTNSEEHTQQTRNTSEEISRVSPENKKDAADSFESAVEVQDEEEKQTATVEVIDADAEEDDDTDVELIDDHPKKSDDDSSKTRSAVQDIEDFSLSETTSKVNISSSSISSEHQFEDASELIATVPLTAPTVSDQTEVDAVLNDVCQLVADEASTLLSDHTDGFESPHNVGVDDFTSVLTHPEVERSLQSAASSTLVPNSQEIVVAAAVSSQATMVPPPDVDVTEDTFASVVAEVERFTKDVNPEIYSESVGITGTDVMMDNVQVRHSLDDIFDDDVDDDIISSLRMSSGSIDICHDKNLPIQVIETEVMAIPNEPDIIFDKPLGTTASILGTTSAKSIGAEKN